jgi:hypothetical protein
MSKNGAIKIAGLQKTMLALIDQNDVGWVHVKGLLDKFQDQSIAEKIKLSFSP